MTRVSDLKTNCQ